MKMNNQNITAQKSGENDTMGWITQKSRSGSLRLQNAIFAFEAQIIGNIRFRCDIAHQSLRQMGVEIIGNKVPLPYSEVRFDSASDMVGKILLIPSWPTPSSHDFTQSDIEVEDERQGPPGRRTRL